VDKLEELDSEENVEQWLKDVDFTCCTKCSISSERPLRYYVSPKGRLDAPIVLVGEAPGAQEEDLGEVFVGPAGKRLQESLQRAGVDLDLLYITNTVKCRPLANRSPIAEECRICRSLFLEKEIKAYPRKLLVGIGNIGYYGIVPKGVPSGITSRTGLFEYNEEFSCYVLPCIHPAAVLRTPSYQSLLDDVADKISRFIREGYTVPAKTSVFYKEIRDLASFKEFISEVKEVKRFVVDIETEGFNYFKDHIICIGFSTAPYTAYYLPILEEDDLAWSKNEWCLIQEGLREIFEDASIQKIGHNLKFDLKFLVHKFGWDVKGLLDDTMLMHFMLDENTSHGLKELAARFTDMGNYAAPLEEAFTQIKRSRIPVEEKHYGKIPVDILKHYASADVDATFRLYELFKKQLVEQDLYRVYRFLCMSVMPVLMHMELTGVRVDVSKIASLKEDFEYQLEELQKKINSYTAESINIRSAAQLRKLLYEDLNLPVLGRTDKGEASTDEETLRQLQEKTGHPVVTDLLEFRRISKLYTTYIQGLSNYIAPDGRIHTSYMQHGTATGRLASSEPNLQQIPRESAIRQLFVATEGWYFITSDFKQSELRAWCACSKDEKFLEALISTDVHNTIGSQLLGKPPDQITSDERTKVKMAVFGIAYGRGANSLAAEWNMSKQAAQEFIDKFFMQYPKAAQWLLEQERIAQEQGFVKSMFGRVRRLPTVKSEDEGVRAQALRQARNSCIQSLSSDITNLALVRLHNTFKQKGMKSRILLQVHDAICIESPPEEVKQAVAILKECMTAQPHRDYDVPLMVDIKVSTCWGGEEIPIDSL